MCLPWFSLGVVGFHCWLGFVGFRLSLGYRLLFFGVGFQGCVREGVLSHFWGGVGSWSSVCASAACCWSDFALVFVVWALFTFTHQFSRCGLVGCFICLFVCFIYFVILGRGVR